MGMLSTATKHVLAALEETVEHLARVSAILQSAGQLGRLWAGFGRRLPSRWQGTQNAHPGVIMGSPALRLRDTPRCPEAPTR